MKNYEDCVNEAARLSFDAGIDPRNILTSKYANLLFELSKAEDLQAKYAAVVAELEELTEKHINLWNDHGKQAKEVLCYIDDIELRDKELAALKARNMEWRTSYDTAIKQFQAEIPKLKADAFKAGFMVSGEGYNGELYQDGWENCISGLSFDLKHYLEQSK